MLMRPDTGDEPRMAKKDFSPSSRPMIKSHKKSRDRTKVDVEDNNAQLNRDENELIVFNPGSSTGEDLLSASNHIADNSAAPNSSGRVLPSVGAFTVQCASCFKWRLIPTKEKYEQIRESILQVPFACERAREWRSDISCEDPPDITQDGSRLWAIDKPNIAQAPHGWDRQLRIRGEGGTRFADVYYVAPSGKKLRSMVEIQRYLDQHPEHVECGVNLSQFSFQTPKPLQDNYVKKKQARLLNSSDGAGLGLPEPVEAFPLSWAAPPIQEAGIEEPEPASGLPSELSPQARKRVAKEQVRRPVSKKLASSSSEHSTIKIKSQNTQHDKEGSSEP